MNFIPPNKGTALTTVNGIKQKATSISSAADADEVEALVKIAAVAADDALGKEIEAFYVGDTLAITDWFIAISGDNTRQVQSIVEKVEQGLTEADGPKPIRIEGKSDASWVLMDYGIFVVHVFSKESRSVYGLGRLWSDAVRMELNL